MNYSGRPPLLKSHQPRFSTILLSHVRACRPCRQMPTRYSTVLYFWANDEVRGHRMFFHRSEEIRSATGQRSDARIIFRYRRHPSHHPFTAVRVKSVFCFAERPPVSEPPLFYSVLFNVAPKFGLSFEAHTTPYHRRRAKANDSPSQPSAAMVCGCRLRQRRRQHRGEDSTIFRSPQRECLSSSSLPLPFRVCLSSQGKWSGI